MRQYTIQQTCERIEQGELFHHAIKEFIDGFKISNHRASLIGDRPGQVRVTGSSNLPDKTYDVLLAGIVCELCDAAKMERPSWVSLPYYYFDSPVFTTDNAEKRAAYMTFTPSYYRSRNLFCGKIIGKINLPG